MEIEMKLKVLLVEDDPAHVAIIKISLKQAGCDVVWCNTGNEAMELIQNDGIGIFDIILLDNNLPDFTGIELLVEMNARNIDKPVIFLTADSNIQTVVEVMRLGATDFLLKSEFMGPELVKMISKVYRIYKSVKEKKRFESQLRNSEERFSRIVEVLPQMLAYIDAEYCYRFVNSSFELFFKTSNKEVFGKKIGNVLGQDVFEKRKPFYELALHGKSIEFDDELLLGREHYYLSGHLIPEYDDEGVICGFYEILLDVSDYRNYEEKLKSSEKRLKDLLDVLPVMVLQMNKELKYVFVNKQYEKYVNKVNSDIIGRKVSDIIGEESFAIIQPYIKKVLKGEAVQYTLDYILQDEGHKCIQASLVPKISDKGNIEGYYSVLNDITELKEYQKKLEVSEERFRTILQQSLDGLLIFNQEGEVLVWNDTLSSITGIRSKDAIGSKIYDLEYQIMESRNKNPEHYERLKKYTSFLFKDFEYSSDAIYKEGLIIQVGSSKKLTVQFETFPIRTTEGLLVGRVVRDISGKVETEKELKKLNERLLMAKRAANFGVIDYDLRNKKLIWDDATVRLLNISENGGDENLESLLKQVHHDDKALVLQVIQDIKGGSYSEQITARFSTVEKICRHVKFFFNGIRNGRAELVRIVGVVIDVSNEIEKLELKQQVEIAEKTAHLKQEFLANISHEMRTPMNAIMGMTNFLLRTQLNDSQESFAKSIKESSENLLSIINNVLDISKIESGVLTLFPKLFSIKDLVRKIDNLFRIEVSRKKLSLDFDTGEDEALYFEADENKVVQVVSNYISNAIKFTDRGGISVDFQVEKIDNAKVIIKISVTDTGIGIAEEDQKKLFSKFTQLDSSMTRSYQGAGLGLSICRELARLMGGEAGVVSREGLGSTFWFTFTGSLVLSEQDRVEKEDFVSSHQILNGMNVLVVEDRFLNYKVISMMLESMGCKSVIAQNGQLGLEAFEKEAFDLILMDIQMPVMDGLTAVKELRKRHDNLPPVVALTANALEGDADYFISQGMDDYISKPVKEDLLKEKLLFWAAKKMK